MIIPKLKSLLSEKNLFILFSLANLIPVCLTFFVGSLDGPQHLHVSNIIGQLLKGNDAYQLFYLFNPPIIGNVLGNFILAVFNLFLPAWVAEKILIIIYLIGFTWGFRYLVISIKGKSDYLTLLIFPFSYHSLFMLGYYNFSLAIAFFFIALGYWIRSYKNLNLKNALVIFILFSLTYFTHVFIFGFLMLSIGLFATFMFISGLVSKEKKAFKHYMVRAGVAVACALPGLILTYMYLNKVSETSSLGGTHDAFDHWKNLANLRILIGFVSEEEIQYTRLLFILLMALTGWIITDKIIRQIRQNKTGNQSLYKMFRESDFLVILVVVFLGFYLYFPNQMSFSVRISILIMCMVMAWIAVQEFPPKLAIFPIVIALYFGISIKAIHVKYLKELDGHIREIQSLEKFIPENTLIMTANFSENWILYHFQNYIGAEKPIIDIKSPAVSDLFAVNWNHKERPFTFVGAKESGYFSGVGNSPRNSPAMVAEYIALVGYRDFLRFNPDDKTKKILARDYRLIYISETKQAALFKYTAGDKVKTYEKGLESSSGSVQALKEKAEEYNIPYETVLQRDALWLYDQSFPE